MFNRHGPPRSRIEFLRTVPLFEGLSDKAPARLDSHLSTLDVQAGRELTHAGGGSFETFIVVEGEADVTVGDEQVATSGAGDLIGEVGVLENTPRNATVVARTPMQLLVVDSREIGWLLEDPAVAARIRDNEARHGGHA